jgi:hypothetical protein
MAGGSWPRSSDGLSVGEVDPIRVQVVGEPDDTTSRRFSVAEARAMLPDVRAIADQVIDLRADLTEAAAARQTGDETTPLADLKAMEAQLADLLDGLVAQGLQVKGFAPLLVDWPFRFGDRELLLCWLEGEDELAWYHDVAHGFPGRRRLDELEA